MVRGIMPAAGYGTRMGMSINQSKEMLRDPKDQSYLIDYSLNLCYSNKIEPIVISRIEKEDLNSYLRLKGVEHIVLKTPGKEWADTVLKSQGLWTEKNILILPDTRFEPANESIKRVKDLLHQYDLVAGVHKVPGLEIDKWGIIDRNTIWEKPSVINPKINSSHKAWGILGFSKSIGEKLFQSQNKHNWLTLSPEIEPAFVHLDKFEDITRTGKLEY